MERGMERCAKEKRETEREKERERERERPVIGASTRNIDEGRNSGDVINP